MRYALPLLLALSACGPTVREGDVYEVAATGERFTVESVGECGAVAAAHEGFRRDMVDELEARGETDEATVRAGLLPATVVVDSATFGQTCFARRLYPSGLPGNIHGIYVEPLASLTERIESRGVVRVN